MELVLKNCNNIDNGRISIIKDNLNIKYAINGTGKTTISQAISFSINDAKNGTESILELKPFKYLDQQNNNPKVEGAEQIKSVRVFDENYVNEFVFLPSELLKGSFDVFIRDNNYENGMKEIDDLVETLRQMLEEDKDIDDLIKDFTELSASFGKPTKAGIHGASTISKALKGGNKIINIPDGLLEYKDYIQCENNFKWIKWQIDGKLYLDISENCPYCTNNIKDIKNKINRISEVYDSKSIENLNLVVGVFQRLNKYFSSGTKSEIENFIKNIDGYTEDQVNYLKEIKNQVDLLNHKFIKVQELGFKSLKDVDKIIDALKSYRIDLNLFIHLQSENTQEKVDIVNNAIDSLLMKAGELQGSINKQKRLIERLVKENSSEINNFLKNAGFQYKLNLIEDDDGQYKLKLIHNDIENEINNVKTHLSFGERNAFSIVLFMYDVLKNIPDLIVLDDPISSFDKNKKYAIVDMLFRKGKGLRGKTVLLLTHDFDPIIDMVYHHSDKFPPPKAVFLENLHGELSEKPITKSNIKFFIELLDENIRNHNNDISKLVYFRRLNEVSNKKGFGYQLVSNLLHKRDKPIILNNDENLSTPRLMEQTEIEEGTKEIQEKFPNFNYFKLLEIITNDDQMKSIYYSTNNNYEKLHIYRIIFDNKKERIKSDIIQKFINQTFHIENDYIYQLNPCDYQLVPQYVIDECDKYLQLL